MIFNRVGPALHQLTLGVSCPTIPDLTDQPIKSVQDMQTWQKLFKRASLIPNDKKTIQNMVNKSDYNYIHINLWW
jgi:hypothetical protein